MTGVETLIIGAGPYGLSLAAHLKARQALFAIVGTPMEAWQNHMPQGMLLRSEAFASSLNAPDGAFRLQHYCAEAGIPCPAIGWPVPLRVFVEYAAWFRARAVGAVIQSRVVQLNRAPGGFRVLLENGEALLAAKVVLAVGLGDFRRIPQALYGLPASHFAHSHDVANPARFRGRDVTLVGAGQSALGLAALLHEQGAKVRVLARTGALVWNGQPPAPRQGLAWLMQPESGLGPGWRGFLLERLPGWFRWLPLHRRIRMAERSWGPSGAWWLRQRVEAGVEVHMRHEITAARLHGGRLALSVACDGRVREIHTDYLIAATGYATDLRRLAFLAPEIQSALTLEGGAPRLSANFESSVAGLFVIGHASAQSFGPVMRFVCGAAYAAPRLARRLLRNAGVRRGGSFWKSDQRLRTRKEVSPL